jgi:hypothetical protein
MFLTRVMMLAITLSAGGRAPASGGIVNGELAPDEPDDVEPEGVDPDGGEPDGGVGGGDGGAAGRGGAATTAPQLPQNFAVSASGCPHCAQNMVHDLREKEGCRVDKRVRIPHCARGVVAHQRDSSVALFNECGRGAAPRVGRAGRM